MGIYLGGMHGGADHLAAQKEYRQADSQRRATAEFFSAEKIVMHEGRAVKTVAVFSSVQEIKDR